MNSDSRNATGGYCSSEGWRDEPAADPPENQGGGLAGDPVKQDYVHPPEDIDPPEPEPPNSTPPS